MTDYDAARAKMKRLVDKPSEDTNKLPRVCTSSPTRTWTYADYHRPRPSTTKPETFSTSSTTSLSLNYLNSSTSVFVSRANFKVRYVLITAYLDPSFEAMVRCQLNFAQEGYEKLSGVQRYFADNIRDDYANGALDGQVEGVLDEMKSLSIYGP